MSKVSIRINYDLEPVKEQVKKVAGVDNFKIYKSNGLGSIAFANSADAEKAIAALNNLSGITVHASVGAKTAEPKAKKEPAAPKAANKKQQQRAPKQKRVQREPVDYSNVVQVECKPDPAAEPVKSPLTLTDEVGPNGGHYYNKEIEGRHIQSVQFAPVKGGALGADISLDNLKFKVLGINVTSNEKGIFVNVRLYEVDKKRVGVISLRQFNNTDGTKSIRRTSYCIPSVATVDRKSDEKVAVSFVSVETITLDPNTCSWSELRIAIDKAEVESSKVRFGTGARRRFFKQRARRQRK